MILNDFTEPLNEFGLPNIANKIRNAVRQRTASSADQSSVDNRIDPTMEPEYQEPVAPAVAPAPAVARAGGYEQEIPLARTNPATGKAYLPSEIPAYVEPKALLQTRQDVEIARRDQELAAELAREKKKELMKRGDYMPGDWERSKDLAKMAVGQGIANKMISPKLVKDLTSPTPSFAKTQAQPQTFSASNIMAQPGMEKYAKPAAPARPVSTNYAQQSGGYSNVNMAAPTAYKVPTVASPAALAPVSPALNLPKVKPGSADAQMIKNLQTPGKATVNTGGPNPYAKKKLATTETVSRVSAMLESVKTKQDIAKIRNYIDRRLVNENQQAFRKALHQKVTEVSAVKRRIAARNAAN